MSDADTSPTTYEIELAGTADGGDRVPNLSPREARDRWLDKLRVSRRESTVSTYHYRLKHFIEWCEREGISPMREMTGWDLESYETDRRGEGLELVSLNNEIGTLQNFLEYCADIEQVDEDLPEKITPPSVPKGEDVSETSLETEDAKQLLEYYRNTPNARYSREHVILEILWHTGARAGGVRGLDLDDYDADGQYLEFVHRPGETPLKKGIDGQRVAGMRGEVCDAIDGYLDENRHAVHDEHGREPLLTTTQGRFSSNAIRVHSYLATIPCLHSPCPHGKDPETCEFIDYSHASKCPSSRSPHQIRTGSITWHLNCGWSIEDVAERVNGSVRTIKQHYDKQNRRDEMEQRRRQHLDLLSFDDGGEE